MEERNYLTNEEKELEQVWESENAMNFFGCGQFVIKNN